MIQIFPRLRLFLAAAALYFGIMTSAVAMPVSVDKRVELMAIVARLADLQEFQAAGIPAYDADVEQHFGGFRKHEAVTLLRRFRQDHGIGYGDTVSLALLAQPGTWKPRIPLQEWLPDSSTHWTEASARQMLAAMVRFERDTKAAVFFRRHSTLHSDAARQIRTGLLDGLDVPWLQAINPGKKPVRMTIVAGLLHGPGNYGPRFLLADGVVDAYAVIGAPELSQDGSMKWPVAQTSRLLVHEFAHSFVNPWVDAHAQALKTGALALYRSSEARMRQNAYGDWETLLYESMTRAVTIRYFRDHDLLDQTLAAQRDDELRGFAWTSELAALLPKTAPLLAADALPSINSLLLAHAEGMAKTQAAAPNATLLPVSGDSAVDPQLKEIVISFDKPMSTDIGVFGDHNPEFSGAPSWSTDGMKLTLPVKLVPDTGYTIQLNHADVSGGFRARDGTPLAPLTWTFRTRR